MLNRFDKAIKLRSCVEWNSSCQFVIILITFLIRFYLTHRKCDILYLRWLQLSRYFYQNVKVHFLETVYDSSKVKISPIVMNECIVWHLLSISVYCWIKHSFDLEANSSDINWELYHEFNSIIFPITLQTYENACPFQFIKSIPFTWTTLVCMYECCLVCLHIW